MNPYDELTAENAMLWAFVSGVRHSSFISKGRESEAEGRLRAIHDQASSLHHVLLARTYPPKAAA